MDLKVSHTFFIHSRTVLLALIYYNKACLDSACAQDADAENLTITNERSSMLRSSHQLRQQIDNIARKHIIILTIKILIEYHIVKGTDHVVGFTARVYCVVRGWLGRCVLIPVHTSVVFQV